MIKIGQRRIVALISQALAFYTFCNTATL